MQNLMKSLEVFHTFQGQIEGFFEDMRGEIGKLQAEYTLKLQEIREMTEAMIYSAIQEVSLQVLNSTYTSENPIVKVIFERISAGNIEEIGLFDLKANEISRNMVITTMGIRIEPRIVGIPSLRGIGRNTRL